MIIIQCIQLFSTLFIFLLVSNKKNGFFEIMLCQLVFLLLSIILKENLNYSFIEIILVVLFSFYKFKWRKYLLPLFFSVCAILLNSLLNYLLINYAFDLMNALVDQWFSDNDFYLQALCSFAPIIVVWSIKRMLIISNTKLFRRIHRALYLEQKKILIVSISMVTTLLILLHVIFYFEQIEGETQPERILTIVLYTCAVMGIMLFINNQYIKTKNSEHQKFKETQFQNLVAYAEQMELLHDEIKSFRHDYVNILTSIEQAILMRDIDLVKEIYEKTIRPTGTLMESNHFCFIKLKYILVAELKSILASKILFAEKTKIDLHLEIEDFIEKIHMDIVDFCRVLSILLDNAIEAAKETQSPKIIIAIIEEKEAQRVIIKNTTAGQDIDILKIWEKGYSSKFNNHSGLGLYAVKQLLDQNRYVTLETSYHQCWFCQSLILIKTG
ncbi:GHKL domain-containing protein [Paenibacillus sp. MMS20-IR301]|uniref:sensor histidine kinase n=1 Tax=Paenibacillus sp. MMS20-IR301 TaxID=2895946 RepID=UPI0028E72F99|nr:GHKL domain-containing protein [Paenibacillus sp. MMS20-IR301]WNS43491.1 GHKL domain-containing protein [Paenibacillus sp. MMS20-IR301]